MAAERRFVVLDTDADQHVSAEVRCCDRLPLISSCLAVVVEGRGRGGLPAVALLLAAALLMPPALPLHPSHRSCCPCSTRFIPLRAPSPAW